MSNKNNNNNNNNNSNNILISKIKGISKQENRDID